MGKRTERRDNWNRAESAGGETAVVVVVVVSVVVGDVGAVVSSAGETAGSDCLPLFHCNDAFSNPILVLPRKGSADRLRLDTQSGTDHQHRASVVGRFQGHSPSSSARKSSIRLTDT